MKTPFTEDQKKRYKTAIVLSTLGGLALGAVIAVILKEKKIQKLEATIYKLEGWQ